MAQKQSTSKKSVKKTNNTKKTLLGKKASSYWKLLIPVMIAVVAVGGYYVYKSYASGYYKYLPQAKYGKRTVDAMVCQIGQNRLRVIFTKYDSDLLTDHAPQLIFARDGVRTGVLAGSKNWKRVNPKNPDSVTEQGSEYSMGNRKYNDTLKVQYATAQGGALRWQQVTYCP